MSNDTAPSHVETKYVYEDKPNLATIMTGGTVFAILLYYAVGFMLQQFNYQNKIVQIAFGLVIIFFSFRIGTTSAVTIKIDTKTGYIEAEDKHYHYTGYAHEPELFMVLEKTAEVNGRTFKDYKLSLKVDEETTYDVPLEAKKAVQAIKVVQQAKDAVPISK